MIGLDFIQQLADVPPTLGVALIAMLPVSELRGAIPVGLGAWHLSWWVTLLAAVVGNMIPVIFILLFMNPVASLLRRHIPLLDKFFTWLFERTRKKIYHQHQKWGDIALVTFVAIPLPATGAWSGALAAFLLGIPFRKALPLITLGVIIAGIIVTLLSLGAISIF